MTPFRDFTYSGTSIHLYRELFAEGYVWIAEARGADLIYLFPYRAGDRIEQIVPRVEEWIDGGMLGVGGPSA
jgi:hypothetical protein